VDYNRYPSELCWGEEKRREKIEWYTYKLQPTDALGSKKIYTITRWTNYYTYVLLHGLQII